MRLCRMFVGRLIEVQLIESVFKNTLFAVYIGAIGHI